MIYHNINQYLEAKNHWRNTFSSLINGEMFAQVADEKIPIQEYLKHNSEPVYERAQVPNPDGKNISGGTFPTKSRKSFTLDDNGKKVFK